jgi:hypothetical protein
VEGEAQAAAAMLQKMLDQHNLSVADLEKRGAKKPGVKEEAHDLGKAAFKWKLNLADAIAEHYYCAPLVDHYAKTVRFVGRPDNVESLLMLYAWVIDQIKRISAEERRNHFIRTNEHVDPLRWQVNFGLGAVSRLRDRLADEAAARTSDSTALVLSHRSEASDYLEEKYGFRIDGQKTKRERERDERYRVEQERREKLKAEDPEAYYAEFPWERPLTPEQQAEIDRQQAAADKKWARREQARQRRWERSGGRVRYESDKQYAARVQGQTARAAGREAAGRVNLRPFVEGGAVRKEIE